jgi:hypothetical protein
MSKCKVRGCERKYYAKGFCKLHYGHQKKYGHTFDNPIYGRLPEACEIAGCGKTPHAKGLCNRHYLQVKKYGEAKGNPSKTKFDKNDIALDGDVCMIYLRGENAELRGVTMIDAEDYPKVCNKKWFLSGDGYAVTDGGKTHLSAVVMGHEMNRVTLIDHKDRNRLDNRKHNLELSDKSLNAINSKTRKDNTSGHRGVSWEAKRGRWFVHIGVRGKNVYIGRYKTLKEAIAAYEAASLRYHGRDINET